VPYYARFSVVMQVSGEQLAVELSCPTQAPVIHCPWWFLEWRERSLEAEVFETLRAWTLGVLVYPGLLFGLLFALIGEWAFGVVWPLMTPRHARYHQRYGHFLQPLNDLLKLAGRRSPARWQHEDQGTTAFSQALTWGCVIAPVLALALLPFPANPVSRGVGYTGDLLTIVALLAVQPLLRAFLRLREGDLAAWRGAQDIGRLLTGLVPTLAVATALVGISGSRSLLVSSLSAAPESWQQSVVRFLAGAVLLVALPWWLA
jgi:hypothetical protein